MVEAAFFDEFGFSQDSSITNPEVLCPTSGEICLARSALIHLFSEHIDAKVAEGLPEECAPKFDAIKLEARLTEYGIIARKIDCKGPTDTQTCPTREAMDASRIRRGSVGFIRKITGRK